MASETSWSDKKKWIMGILSALIVATVIALFSYFRDGERTLDSEPPTTLASTPTVTETPAVTPPPTPTPAPAATPTPLERTADDFMFLLRGCGPDGNDLRCRFLVTNNRGPRRLMISNRSRLIGRDGRSFNPDTLIKDTGRRSSISIFLDPPTGQGIEFSLLFSQLATSVTEAARLELKSAEFTIFWDNPPIE